MFHLRKIQRNRGMTYVELIVVLAIFAVMSSIVIFNYGDFQAKVDIKNLASDIALQIVEAQKSALSGKWNSSASDGWNPSYGVYFDLSDNKQFIYFADVNTVNNYYDGSSFCTGECMDKITITKGNYIDKIEKYTNSSSAFTAVTPLSIVFKRPNSKAILNDGAITGLDYIQITVKSPKGNIAKIKVYPSGRIQVN